MNLPKAHSDTYGYGPRQQMAYALRWGEWCNNHVLEKNETTSCGLLRYLSGFGRMNARRAWGGFCQLISQPIPSIKRWSQLISPRMTCDYSRFVTMHFTQWWIMFLLRGFFPEQGFLCVCPVKSTQFGGEWHRQCLAVPLRRHCDSHSLPHSDASSAICWCRPLQVLIRSEVPPDASEAISGSLRSISL